MPLLDSTPSLQIEKIYTYPIKALRAVELQSAQVTRYGVEYDRHFLLIELVRKDGGSVEHENVHVATYPESVHFHQSISRNEGDNTNAVLTVTFKPPRGESSSIDVPLLPDTSKLEPVNTVMHESPSKAYKMGDRYNQWFSKCYGKNMILTYLGEHRRPVLMSRPDATKHSPEVLSTTPSNASTGWLSSLTSVATTYLRGPSIFAPATSSPLRESTITFTDCAPLLITSTTSLADLQPRLPAGEHMDMLKFRPNLVVRGAGAAWEEDYWAELLTIPTADDGDGGATGLRIACAHNCGRCTSINLDYATGAPGTTAAGRMLRLMQRDRRVDPGMKYSPIFGRYAFLADDYDDAGSGRRVRVGDEVVVSRRNEER